MDNREEQKLNDHPHSLSTKSTRRHNYEPPSITSNMLKMFKTEQLSQFGDHCDGTDCWTVNVATQILNPKLGPPFYFTVDVPISDPCRNMCTPTNLTHRPCVWCHGPHISFPTSLPRPPLGGATTTTTPWAPQSTMHELLDSCSRPLPLREVRPGERPRSRCPVSRSDHTATSSHWTFKWLGAKGKAFNSSHSSSAGPTRMIVRASALTWAAPKKSLYQHIFGRPRSQ